MLPFPFFIQVLGQRVEAAVQERHGVQELEVVEGEGDKLLELCNAFLSALTLPCYGLIPPRQCPRVRTHSKNVPLSLTRRDGHEKPLLFFVPLT